MEERKFRQEGHNEDPQIEKEIIISQLDCDEKTKRTKGRGLRDLETKTAQKTCDKRDGVRDTK